jgi:thiol:disulfide interchange protein
MMRKITFFFLLVLVPLFSYSQILKPVTFSTDVSSESARAGDEVELIFRPTIINNWYMYTNGFDPECGPIPLEIIYEPDDAFEVVGGLVAIKDQGKFDKNFECDVRYFEVKGELRQKIKLLKPGPLTVKASYEGQSCSNIDGQCVQILGDLVFREIAVSGTAEKPAAKATEPKTAEPVKKLETSQAPLNMGQQPVSNEKNLLNPLPPDTATVALSAEQTGTGAKNHGPILDPSLVQQTAEGTSFWGFFLLAFLAGLAALLTPCVFPMIPMTVSYFTAPGRTRAQAILYGLSIVIIYTLIGAALAPLMGPETANHLSTEWLPNIIFFLVFMVFGLSFLGLFDITLPGTFVTKVDRQADRGGLIGVFFMAFTLVLVSFSCTGPIVGSILVSSAGGEFIKPIVGMLGFSLAFAIPFTTFAFFPRWLSSLPKSGGWLNSVKVVLGFIEIALAFKFLSIADQAFHWRLLDREINIAIWIVITILIGAYLMKFFRLPGDTGKDIEDKRVGIPRLVLAMTAFTFAVYLIPGMWGAPLKALAGYLPPLYTHDFDLISKAREDSESTLCEDPKYADFLHLPHGLQGYFDYDQAIACARKLNKPLFIDFTGHGCTNCREMEAVVWSDPQVLQRLREDYVVVALYVDDKTEKPESEWYTAQDGKVKKTIGKQNADLQITKLNNNAQPFYVLVGRDERVLVSPYGYDRDPSKFAKFLDEGKKRFRELY